MRVWRALAESLAEPLLRAERHTVDEVAQRVGSTSRSAFERAFVRWTGLTPARWRREHAG